MKKLLSAVAAAVLTTAALPAFAVPRQVTGTLLFEDAKSSSGIYISEGYRPIRNVTVYLKVDGNQVASTETNSAGEYSTWIESSQLPVGHTLTIEYKSANYAGVVKLDLDWFDDEMLFSNNTVILDPSWPLVLSDIVEIGQLSQHMSILDAVLWGRQYANARRADDDDIGYVSVEYPDADWSSYDDFWGDITLAGPAMYGYGGNATDHGFSDDVVLHEYGHHVSYDISSVDGNNGQTHDWCSDNGYAFAWSEGWPTYFAATVKFTWPNALFSGFPNIESLPGCPTVPAGSEAVTQSILWDLFDGLNNETIDRMDGGTIGNSGAMVRDTLFAVLDVEQDDAIYPNNPPTTILGFHDHLVARDLYYGAHADMDRIYVAHGVQPHPLSDFSVAAIVPNPSTVVAGNNVDLTMTLSNSGFFYTDEELLVTVSVWPSGQSEQYIDAFLLAGWIGDHVVSRSVNIPSNVPHGTQAVFVRVDLLNRFPESAEKNNVLAIPLQIVACGDGVCNGGESCSTCSKDCGSCGKCGNGVCSSAESCASCPKDCGKCGCGDGLCQGKENKLNCPQDCAAPGP